MRKVLRLTAATVAVGIALTGCGSAGGTAGSSVPNELTKKVELRDGYDPDAHFRYASLSYTSSWDPTLSVVGTADSFWYEPVYDRLLFLNGDGGIEPMLATEYEVAEDGSSLTLKLREGQQFSDGAPFDAEAVKFNLDRSRAPASKIASELSQVTSVDVVDPLTVRINVDGAVASLPVALAGRSGMPVSPAAVKAGTIATQPVGIGPYVASSITPGAEGTFTKTENYWDPDVQRAATMTYTYVADDQARLNALISGEVDGANLSADQFNSALDADLQVVGGATSAFLYVDLNTSAEPFDNPEVRKALNMAIDREGIAQGLYEGYCVPQIQPFQESSVGYSEKIGDGLDIFPYDPEAAKKILEENGAADLKSHIVASNVTIYTKLAEVIQQNFKEAGMTISVGSVATNQMMQEFLIDKSAPMMGAAYVGLNDPDAVHQQYIASGGLFNPGGGTHPELDELAVEGVSTSDPEQRKATYEKYMDAWVENPPSLIPICAMVTGSGFGKNVSGVTQPSTPSASLRGAAIDPE